MANPPALKTIKKLQAAEPAVPEVAERSTTRRSSQKGTAVRQAVLETAAELFAERGFSGTSFSDIADALGMSRPGLYYYFPSKESLLEALVEEVNLSRLQEGNVAERLAKTNPMQGLQMLVRRNCEWQAEHGRMFRVLERSESELPPALRHRHEEGKRASLVNMTAIIEHGIQIGQFRPTDATVAAFAIIGMCNWMAWWYRPDGRVAGGNVVKLLADFAVHAVLRVDSHRSRSERVEDILRVLKEDVAHLERVLGG